jgi:hypothetical protein
MNKTIWIMAGIFALLASAVNAADGWAGHSYRVSVATKKSFQMTFTVHNSSTISIKDNKFGRSSQAEVSNVVVTEGQISFFVKFAGKACGPGSSGTMVVYANKRSGKGFGSWQGTCAKHGKKFNARVRELKLVQ